MKKILTGLIAASALIMMAFTAQAADYTNTAGASITVSAANVSGAADMIVNPSPQVLMQINVGALRFCSTTAHTGAYNVTGGKEFAASFDSSKIFWRDISGIATPALMTLTTRTSGTTASATTYVISKEHSLSLNGMLRSSTSGGRRRRAKPHLHSAALIAMRSEWRRASEKLV